MSILYHGRIIVLEVEKYKGTVMRTDSLQLWYLTGIVVREKQNRETVIKRQVKGEK